jgi:SAM-dependent methyltransferase
MALPLRKIDSTANPSPILVSNSGIYQNGTYRERNPTWHAEESPFKVRQIVRMMKKQNLAPRTVCDVGCGAGLVLTELQHYLPPDCVCWGYDVSPDALALRTTPENSNLHFCLRDVRREKIDAYFDLLLMLDVFEHVEDYIGLVRDVKDKAKYKLFHIPLDLSLQAVARRNGLLRRRDDHAHLHYFTKETAIRTLTDVGYRVVDWFYTPRCIELGDRMVQRIARLPRQISFAISKDLTVRTLGGYSLLVLGE